MIAATGPQPEHRSWDAPRGKAPIPRLLVATGIFLAACSGGPREDEARRQRLTAYVVTEPPTDVGKRLDIDFGGEVTLLGAKVEPARSLRPGDRVRLTLYWRAEAAVGAGWNLFTHLLDGSGERVANLDNVGPLREWREGRQVYGPWAWQPGKVYIDEQEFTLPPQIRTRAVQLVTGLWKDSERMPIRSGPRDRHQRGIVADLTLVSEPSEPMVPNTRVPELRVDRLPETARITIDGRLDEPAWALSSRTGTFRNVGNGQPNRDEDLGGEARLSWDAAALYVGFTVVDHRVVGGFDPRENDPHLWTRDTVEIMVDPDGDGDNRDYYEIQINPQNLVFDSYFEQYNSPREEPDGPFGHERWSAKLESAVTVQGKLDDDATLDAGYVVEARIPWSAFHKAARVPPRVGDEWRLNFYAMEKNRGVAWSPILGQGNFHKASRFGRVVWAESGWSRPGGAPSSLPNPSSPPSARGPLKLVPLPSSRPTGASIP